MRTRSQARSAPAAVSALRGEADAALEWLDRAFEAGCRDYGFLQRDPMFRPLASHARFVSVLDRMRSDVEAQRERARTRGLLELQSLIGAAREEAPVVHQPRPRSSSAVTTTRAQALLLPQI